MIEWLSGWYNWPFLFFLAIAVIFILLDLVLGSVSDLLGDLFDTDADADVDVDADADLDADLDGGHGHGHGVSGWLSGLTWLGVGKIPISIVFETLFIVFGVLGLLVNAVWSELGLWPWLSFPAALVVAVAGSLLLTAWLSEKLAIIMPADSTISRPAVGFIGELGTVIRTVTPTCGQVKIEGSGTTPDAYLNCKRDPDQSKTDILRGSQVVVVDYLDVGDCYVVAPMEEM